MGFRCRSAPSIPSTSPIWIRLRRSLAISSRPGSPITSAGRASAGTRPMTSGPCRMPTTRSRTWHVPRRIERLQERLGRRILIENVSSDVAFAHSTMTEWEFLAALVKRAGCGLLLDVNNVFVKAQNHSFDAHRYLDELPLGSVGQIHFAGLARRAPGQRWAASSVRHCSRSWMSSNGIDVAARSAAASRHASTEFRVVASSVRPSELSGATRCSSQRRASARPSRAMGGIFIGGGSHSRLRASGALATAPRPCYREAMSQPTTTSPTDRPHPRPRRPSLRARRSPRRALAAAPRRYLRALWHWHLPADGHPLRARRAQVASVPNAFPYDTLRSLSMAIP